MSFINENLRSLVPGQCLKFSSNTGLWEFNQDQVHDMKRSEYNRSIDKLHARSLEDFIERRAYRQEAIDTLKLCIIRRELTACKPGEVPNIYIIDGQHRHAAMKELRIRDAGLSFTFYGDVQIVSAYQDIGKIVKALQNSIPLSTRNEEGMSSRSKFNEALKNIVLRTGESETRQCLRNLPVITKIADNTSISRALTRMTVDDVEKRLIEIAEHYLPIYNPCSVTSRATRQVITRTKLYQLMDGSHKWLDLLAGLAPSTSTKRPVKREPMDSVPSKKLRFS